MPVPQLLVFDLDGTLIDSSLDLCNAVNAALEHLGKPLLPHHQITSYIGDGAATLIQRALAHDGEPAEFSRAFDYFLTWYRAHKLDSTYVYPGVLAALTSIRTRHPQLPMAVLTNKPVYPSREICQALGLAPFFFQNYGGNSFPTKKPDPEGLLALISEASSLIATPISPAAVTMIGDSDVDVLTARSIGARSLGCAYGLSPEALARSAPDLSVWSPEEWVAALGL